MKSTIPFLCLLLLLLGTACETPSTDPPPDPSRETLEAEFTSTLQKHLDAVTNRDLTALRATMSPDNQMTLILPATEVITTVDSFMSFHEAWFQDTTWTFETEIISTEIGLERGFAVTELIYREPERDGRPYFNRMTVSYGLERKNNHWYVIHDHAASTEKSTDNE